MNLSTEQSIVQEVHIPELIDRNITLFVKRDDLIHELVSGNKWRKLKYNIAEAIHLKKSGILTFGGAYSNHLLATASACNLAGLNSVGIVRGEELTADSNETLRQCQKLGMKLQFVSRDEYSLKDEKQYLEELQLQFPGFYIVPEGGSNYLGVIGCQEILKECNQQFDIVVLAVGTATTAAGVLLSAGSEQEVWAVPVLKGFSVKENIHQNLRKFAFEEDLIQDYLLQIIELNNYHFGGYAKYNNEIIDFIERAYKEWSIPLDPVYTGKAFFALVNEIKEKDLKNRKILFIHTGGLQGSKVIFEKEKRTIY